MAENRKREGFNFYLSYFDVFNELPNDTDKVNFITALLERQFYGSEPQLSGMAKFAYISQKHSIDKQVKGWEVKAKCKLTPPIARGVNDINNPPSQQVQVQGKEKEKEKVQLRNIEYRKAEFKNSLIPFLKNYSKSLLNDFYNYWTEHGINDKKMKFEKQRSFGIKQRLNTWAKNEKKFNSNSTLTAEEKLNKALGING